MWPTMPSNSSSFEGIPDGDPSTVKIDADLDPVGIWTIGWGHAIAHQGR